MIPVKFISKEKRLRKACLVCGRASEVENYFSDISIYRCPVCDHCFSDIDNLNNNSIYDENYFEHDHKNWFTNPNINLFRNIRDVIARKAPNPSVVELGCGKGNLLKFLIAENSRLDLTGIDLVHNNDINGIKFIQGDVFSIKSEKKYDVVITLAVIEHIPDPHAYIKLLKNMCKDDGLIIIMTLNDRSILYHLARLLNKVDIHGPYRRLYGKHHLNHFNRASLNRLLELNRLENLQTINHDIPFNTIDTGIVSYPLNVLMKTFIMVIFWCGKLTGHRYLQTVICKKID